MRGEGRLTAGQLDVAGLMVQREARQVHHAREPHLQPANKHTSSSLVRNQLIFCKPPPEPQSRDFRGDKASVRRTMGLVSGFCNHRTVVRSGLLVDCFPLFLFHILCVCVCFILSKIIF